MLMFCYKNNKSVDGINSATCELFEQSKYRTAYDRLFGKCFINCKYTDKD